MATEPVPPSLSPYKPSDNERQAYQHLFDKADTDGLGVLTGDKAVPFFENSKLNPAILGTVWGIADPNNTGFLSPHRFGAACRLIGHAQQAPPNTEVKDEWLSKAGPFPRFEGFQIPSHLGSGTAQASSGQQEPAPLQMQGTGSGAGSLAGNTVTPEEKTRYATLFAKSGAVNGLLDGDKARDIFIKSKLPFETLGQIWNLADTQSRGSLDVVDFTIGMHLIQHTMNGALQSLPAVLNPGLYASAASLPLPNAAAPTSPQQNNAGGSRFATGAPASPMRQGSLPPQQQQRGFPAQQQQPWDISAQEKLESDGYFDGIDSARKGTIEGEAAVGFFLQSGLQMDVLARVWDLADIRQTGALNKDEFAVALKLIRDRVAGKDLPQTLPIILMPPSLRSAGQQQQQQQQPPSVQRDLLDLMDDDPTPATSFATSAPAPIMPQGTGSGMSPQQFHPQRSLSPQLTGSRAMSPQPQAARALSPQTTGQATPQYGLAGTIFPQATGGSMQTLSPQTTGFGQNFAPQTRSGSTLASAAPVAAAAAAAATSANFFDENDNADKEAQLAADTTQLKSLQSEHSTAEAAASKVKTQRADIESQLSATTAQINELQVKLSQARAAHETERTMLDDLTKRNEEQKAMLSRARHELITAESDLSALRVERTEIEGNFLRDKEDVRDLKKKMSDVVAETNTLKEMLEKLKKEARQQKGLVAISKKQLASTETEKDKVSRELQEAKTVGATRSIKQEDADDDDSPFDHFVPSAAAATAPMAVAQHAAGFPLPNSPAVTSPAGSVRSNNPFDRIGAFGGSSKPLSPQATGTSSMRGEPSTPASQSAMSLPVAAAAAVGTGAVAAAAAIGAGFSHMLGTDKDESKPDIHEEPRDIEDIKPQVTVESSTSEPAPELDPFGMPVAQTASDTPAVASVAPAADTFGDDFSQGFGDDFGAGDASAAATGTDDSAFDDAFGEQSVVPSTPALDDIEHGSTRDMSAEPVAHSAPPVAAVSAFDSTAPIQQDSERAQTPTRETENVFDSPRAPVGQEADADSSDDEDEVEEAGPSRYAAARGSETDTPQATTSTSDSGESYVHVSEPSAQEEQAISSFPPLDDAEPMPTGSVTDSGTLPTSTARSTSSAPSISSQPDTFSDAQTGEATTPAEDLPSSASLEPSVMPEVIALPSATSSQAPTPTTTQRRAAPPPPVARSSLPPLGAVVTPSSNAAFDDSFGSDFGSTAPATGGVSMLAGPGVSAAGVDDFDSAFEGMGSSPSTSQPAASTSTAPDDFDSFDDPDFTFQPTEAAATSNAKVSGNADMDDDDAFAEFDSSFAPSSNTAAQQASMPDSDDSDSVQQVVAMGFSREKAVEALEKSNFDVQKAINSLLG